MFYLYCTRCNAVFLFLFKSALSLVHVEEVSIFVSSVWQRYLEREDWEENREDSDRTGPHTPIVSHVDSESDDGMERELSTPQPPCWTLKTDTIPSLFSPSIFFPPPCGSQTTLSSEGWTLDSCSGHCVASDDSCLDPPCPLEWPVEKPTQTALESPTCLKCTQMQFDLSSRLWEAHLATAALLFILFTKRTLKRTKKRRKKKDIYLVMFSYGFVPLWFQVVVCFVALIFLILPAALSSVVWKLMMCCFFLENI